MMSISWSHSSRALIWGYNSSASEVTWKRCSAFPLTWLNGWLSNVTATPIFAGRCLTIRKSCMQLDDRDRGRLRDIIDWGDEAIELLGAMTGEAFANDRRAFLAVLHRRP